MAISIRSGMTVVNPVGAFNVSTEPAVISVPKQADLRVGDLDCVAVIFQSPIGTTTHTPPAGFTTISPSLTSGFRLMVVYARPVTNQAALDATVSAPLKAGATATRVIAFRFSMAGVDLSDPVNVTGTASSAVSGDTFDFYDAVTGDFPLYFTYTNNASTSTHPVHGTVGGTAVAQAMAVSNTPDPASDTVFSVWQGGERTTFSVAVANGGSFGLSFNPAAVVDMTPKAKIKIDGVLTNVLVKYIVDNNTIKPIKNCYLDSAPIPDETETDPEPSTGTYSEGLWFNNAAIEKPFTVPGKTMTAHSFPPYPLHIGSSDYYANNYFPLVAQSSTEIHHAEGGFLRNGPIAPPRVGADDFEQDVNDHILDIQRATKIGIDVFVIDVISTSGNNAVYIERLIEARHRLGNNKNYTMLTPMLDCNGGVVESGGAAGAALHIAKHKGKFGTWILDDGRMPVGAFKMEDAVDTPPAFWVELTKILIETYNIRPAYMGAMNGFSSTNVNNIKNALVAAGYTDAFYSVGPWGVGGQDPNIVKNTSNIKTTAAAAGLRSYYPIQAQNIRPGTSTTAAAKVPAGKSSSAARGVYDEAVATEAYRAGWDKIIAEGADDVQGVTWNDYSEGGEIQPSLARGWCVADLTSWYLHKYYFGAFPPITRDNIILSHRSQFAFVDGPEDVTNTMQTSFMWQWERGGTETVPQDIVEALVFLTAPATVEIKVGSTVHTQAIATAGMHAVKVPLGVGTISSRILRNSVEVIDVISPITVVQKPVVDDKQYFMFSALRGTQDQRDPTDNKTLTMVPPATAPVTGDTPGELLNIGPGAGQNHFLVQVAVTGDTTQSHSMNEIANGYQRNPEFYAVTEGDGTGWVNFRTNVNAPILDNSSWPRCELREVDAAGIRMAFNAKDSGTHWMYGRTKITHLPEDRPENVVVQLHDGARDGMAVRTRVLNGVVELVFRLYSNIVYKAIVPYTVGTEFRWMIRVTNGIPRAYFNNMTTPVWTGTSSSLVTTSTVNSWYFKVGNYVQSTTAYESNDAEYGSSRLRDLRHWHTGWPANYLGDPLGT